jgi:hypothetical protein
MKSTISKQLVPSKRTSFVLFFFLFFGLLGLLKVPSIVADYQVCISGCCKTIPDNQCINLEYVDNPTTGEHCDWGEPYAGTQCPDGSFTCTGSCGGGGDDDGGGVCTPNATECVSDCASGCRGCNGDGTGWSCVDSGWCDWCNGDDDGSCTPNWTCGACSATCGTGTRTCTDGCGNTRQETCCQSCAPTAPTLSSPINNSVVDNNSVNLTWKSSSWGVNCSGATRQFKVQIQPNCTGNFIEVASNLSSTTYSYNLKNLEWNKLYCWRVVKTNGYGSVNSAIWRFTTRKVPSFTTFTVANDTCGNGISGVLGQTNVSNPMTYGIRYLGTPGDDFRQLWVALIPQSAVNTDTITTTEMLSNATIAFKYNIPTSTATLWDPTAWVSNGDILNNTETVKLLGIGTQTTSTVNPTNGAVNSNITFEYQKTLAAGTYNIYSALLIRLGDGTLVTSHATATNKQVFKKNGSWQIDMRFPSASLSEPTYNGNKTFDITWNASDANSGVARFRSYVYSNKANSQIRNNTLEPDLVISPPVSEQVFPAGSNTGITYQTLGSYNFFDLTPALDATYVFKLSVEDRACNLRQVKIASLPNVPWLISYQGSISGNGGISGFQIPKLTTFTIPNTTETGQPYLSTYSAISGNASLLSKYRSKSSQYITDYVNDAINPPKGSGAANLYDYFYNLVSKNVTSAITTVSGNQTIAAGALTSTIFPNSKPYKVDGSLTINEGAKCNRQNVIFVNGNLTIYPNFTNTAATVGCLFIVNGNTIIQKNTPKTTAALTSTDPSLYAELHAMIITNGTFRIFNNNFTGGGNTKWDGLYIKGAIVSKNVMLQRDLNQSANQTQPATIFVYDPFYKETFKNYFAVKSYSIREVTE